MTYKTYSGGGRWQEDDRSGRGGRILLVGLGALVVLAGGAVIAVAALWPKATLTLDPHRFATVKLAPAGEHVASATISDDAGRRYPARVHAGTVSPVGTLPAGATLHVRITVKRSGLVSWLVGGSETVSQTFTSPSAHLRATILRPKDGSTVKIRFDAPVSLVVLGTPGTTSARRIPLARPRTEVDTGIVVSGANRFGSLDVSWTPRSWVTPSPVTKVSWFPAGAHVQALVTPAPGATISPNTELSFTFSEPVAAFGTARPSFEPATEGTWTQTGPNSLTFHPTGQGFPIGAHIAVSFPVPTDVAGPGRSTSSPTLTWEVPAGTTLRLEELLARMGYLPLDWHASGKDVPNTAEAQAAAAIAPPDGTFDWRYADTPAELKALWSPGGWTRMTQGAVMAFQNDEGLAVDGIPGPHFWHALIAATLAGKSAPRAYSYVYVNRTVPQTLHLWSAGQEVLTARVNTGVPGAPTPYGTHAVFEHIETGRMQGRNPDGSRYNDPGIKWISYFNHGEAIHGFNRATYGFPQSVGCVEAPITTAEKIWPYTPIGTLVTIEP